MALNAVHEDKLANMVNRCHLLLHSTLLSLFLYHRLSNILTLNDAVSILLFVSELLLSLFWLSEQAFRWKIVRRAAFLHNLPKDESTLPPLDVFICTADPDKEPTVEVMNTVISAMSLDYPIEKLHVYLSDDGGSHATLAAIKEAWGFATWWVPFCRRYGIKCRTPMAYFDGQDQTKRSSTSEEEYDKDKLLIKDKYELFKQRVEDNRLKLRAHTDNNYKTNHPPLVQVINEDCTDSSMINPDHSGVPLLVYVAREKRPSYPHHFKAGALNVLLRVSRMLSNSPIVLMLDCDMYCNDPTSAKQAMCFYLDPKISISLGFVQFPQRFHNLSKHPIYDDDFRWAFKVLLLRKRSPIPTPSSISYSINNPTLHPLDSHADPTIIYNKKYQTR